MYSWLPLNLVEDASIVAEDWGVSEVARSPRGFLAAYRRARGNPEALPEQWVERRRNFIARHMAQVKRRGEPLWDERGRPTRRHVALVMWAYSPGPARFDRWLEAVLGG